MRIAAILAAASTLVAAATVTIVLAQRDAAAQPRAGTATFMFAGKVGTTTKTGTANFQFVDLGHSGAGWDVLIYGTSVPGFTGQPVCKLKTSNGTVATQLYDV